MTSDMVPDSLDGLVSVNVQLHFDSGGRPVGWVARDDGEKSSFVGWLALMGECSRLLAGCPESEDQP